MDLLMWPVRSFVSKAGNEGPICREPFFDDEEEMFKSPKKRTKDLGGSGQKTKITKFFQPTQ
jgi:hypothetical protein